MVMTTLLCLALSGAPKVDDKLVGTWMAGGMAFMTLNANGTGVMEDGKLKWSADGKTLAITDEDGESDKVSYTVSGTTLTLNMGGIPMALTKAAGGEKVKKQSAFAQKAEKANRVSEEEADKEAMAEAQAWLQKNGQGGAQGQPAQGMGAPAQGAPAARGKAAGNDQISQLLLSSAWCSFTYNQRTGASATSRYQFYRDGTWSTGSRAETYNTGINGTVAGQYDGSDRGRWEVRNGQLWMQTSEMPAPQPVTDFRVSRNSNGSPIINADGKEFASCN